MLTIGPNCYVNSREIEAIIPPESAPVKRMISDRKDADLCIEATYGKRVKSVIILKSGKIVLSAVTPETLSERFKKLRNAEI